MGRPSLPNRPLKFLRAAFARRFGRPPRFAAAAPGRVNLIGEHTDYNDGYVLPMAIDREVVVVADRATGPDTTLWAVDLDESVTVDLAGPLSPGRHRFANYLLGVAAGFAREHALPALDVAVAGTVPMGAGLGSSAAMEVAFATILRDLTGARLDPVGVAKLCQRGEHEFAGTPCGIMDMLVATLARPGQALLIDCRNLRAVPTPLPPSRSLAVLVADTTERHDLADGAYADCRRVCAEAAAVLGVASLRDAETGMLAGSSLGSRQLAAARHVICENQRVLLVAAAMVTGDMEAVGELMFDSHASLRDLLGVSCPQLDALVEIAHGLRGDGGVIGARMTGGGFGGCAVVLCRPEAVDPVTDQLEAGYTRRFGTGPVCFAVVPSGPAYTFTP